MCRSPQNKTQGWAGHSRISFCMIRLSGGQDTAKSDSAMGKTTKNQTQQWARHHRIRHNSGQDTTNSDAALQTGRLRVTHHTTKSEQETQQASCCSKRLNISILDQEFPSLILGGLKLNQKLWLPNVLYTDKSKLLISQSDLIFKKSKPYLIVDIFNL